MTEDIIDEQQLQELKARTNALPRNIEPPPDAWAAIRAAIEAPEAGGVTRKSSWRMRSAWNNPAFLAAAAVLLVAGSSAITAVAIGRRTDSERLPAASAVAVAGSTQSRPGGAGPATLAEFTVVENGYIRTANQLSEILRSEESKLAPETVATLQESLRVIDAAILEARHALATDPANSAIVEMLSGSYEQKLDLLRRSTELARS